jgi:phospholipid/cholesterol/gamma-HCH transport system substrate-binding protein
METRARYLAIGLFTLTVIAAGFAFVFWLYSGGGFRERTEYRIRFDNPVSGLLEGSAVLFNGIRVGEVTTLGLSAEKPKQVNATIAIDPATPVRTDTIVGMDFQGLTGAPVILLTGGSATASAPASEDGQPPLLIAEPDSGQSMTQAARSTLRKLDGILDDNAKPLNDVIENFKTFSDALARNSDKIDSVVAGIARLTGGDAASGKLPIYTLNPAKDFPPLDGPQRGDILIPEPTALMSMSSDKILIARDGSVGASIQNAQWSDNLPVLFQAKEIESFENSGYFKIATRPIDLLEADQQVVTDLRTFRIVTEPETAATVEFASKILSGSEIKASRVFKATVPITGTDSATAAAGLNEAFQKTMKELVEWAAANSSPAKAAPASDEPAAPESDDAADAMTAPEAEAPPAP